MKRNRILKIEGLENRQLLTKILPDQVPANTEEPDPDLWGPWKIEGVYADAKEEDPDALQWEISGGYANAEEEDPGDLEWEIEGGYPRAAATDAVFSRLGG